MKYGLGRLKALLSHGLLPRLYLPFLARRSSLSRRERKMNNSNNSKNKAPLEKGPNLRFNYYSIPSDAGENDHYANDSIWELTPCELAWWVGGEKLESDLFSSGRRPELQRGERIAQVATLIPQLRNVSLRLPLTRSYCIYRLRLFAHQANPAGQQAATLLGSAAQDNADERKKLLAELRASVKGNTPARLLTRADRQEQLSQLTKQFKSASSEEEAAVATSDTIQEKQPAVAYSDVSSRLLGSHPDAQAFSPPVETPIEHRDASAEPLLYLFNVIVALEWEPDDEDYHQLAWAFRRASDFLYDISDGTLAFGQVVIGWGQAFMDVADIQIGASNRMVGRAWVGGLHEPSKRMPIRLGRGEWRRSYSIPWDEPEGFRVIVHEWAHYALHLRDAYLDRVPVQKQPDGITLTPVSATAQDNRVLLTPKSYLLGLSILETLDGASELMSVRLESDDDNKQLPSERDMLDALYPSGLREKGQIQNGPGTLPLPFPHIVRQGYDNGYHGQVVRFDPAAILDQLRVTLLAARTADPVLSPFDRCWLFVYRQSDAGEAEQFIAQGTLESKVRAAPFRLLGAASGDKLLIVVYRQDYQPVVHTLPIDGSMVDTRHLSKPFSPNIPFVEVLPRQFGEAKAPDPNELPAPIEVSIRLRDTYRSQRPDTIWVCPLGGKVEVFPIGNAMQEGNSFTVRFPPAESRALDGHVVLWYGENAVACAYSHGGNPPKHTPTAPPENGTVMLSLVPGADTSATGPKPFVPITAGSSDGTVRIYFEVANPTEFPSDEKAYAEVLQRFNDYYSNVRIITTMHSGPRVRPPVDEAQALSPIFTLSSNTSLRTPGVPAVNASLEVRFARLDRSKVTTGQVLLYRLEQNSWQIVPSYAHPSFDAVAAILDSQSELYAEGLDLAEHYQVWWVPTTGS